ncbi:sensor histidine kinase [Paenibacillus koleovorans]|uniref:sensor histidine kinase n=1 Tax=Paenibacillus koleovorans TaxID=121608 RepID=UPI000FD94556|nr:sensor histidine kinase [Paenibacillus koleovorans]
MKLLKRSYASIRQFVRRFGMPKRWLLTYMLLIVVPAGILLYTYYQRSTSILEEEVTKSMLQAIKQGGVNLSSRLEHIEDISDTAFMYPKLYEYLLEEDQIGSIGRQLEVFKDLSGLISTVQNNRDVYRLRLFVDKSKLYSAERINFFSMEELKDRPLMNKLIEASGAIVWTGVYKETYVDRGTEGVYVLSGARILHDPKQYGQMAGVLMVDVAEQTITDVLSELVVSQYNAVYLADSNGIIVSHPNHELIGTAVDPKVWKAMEGQTEGNGRVELDDEPGYVVFTSVKPTGWKLIAQIPASEISERAKINQYAGIATLLAIFALFLVLAFVLVALIVRSMNRRVQQVIKLIRKQGVERFDELQPMPEGDFLMLERSVDHLILRLQSLMQQTYKAQVQEREAQLRALQAQINPHFLYNTLDTINWIAIGRGATDISQMIDALAKYFRLSLNKGRDRMSVADELNLAQVYLEIQKSRFLGTFDYTIDCEPEAESLIVPKLTLQPIVENALLHGIRKTKEKRGHIHINARREDGMLVLSVTDDGIGMEAETAQRLLVVPQEEIKTDGIGSSYGLFNVNERIKLFAGAASGLTIESSPGVGTTVSVRIEWKEYDRLSSGH